MSEVLFEKRGAIGLITLNAPQRLNALNSGFMDAIDKALDEVDADKGIYVLVITGTEKAFIAGADIKQMLELNSDQAYEWAKKGLDLNDRIENLRVPVIAAINGFALGGGNELAMACDIRIASSRAKFGQPECGLGIPPGAGGTQRLPRIVGQSIAKELMYTGRIIDAAEALRIGLVNRVTEPEELMEAVIGLAEEISVNAQIAVQQIKEAVNKGIDTDLASGLEIERRAFGHCCGTEDKRIAMTAFVNKEKEKKFVYR